MQALLQKQQQSQKLRSVLAGGDGEDRIYERTLDEKVAHCKELQYVQHQQLFAVSYTSLHKAAAENSLVGVKFFLTRRNREFTPIDALDKHGMSALHCAAEHGCNDVVHYLLDEGCDVDARSSYDSTPLMLACKENRTDTIALLLEAGADVTARNKAGMNCLHFAAQSDHAASVEAVAACLHYHRSEEVLTASQKESADMASELPLDYDFVPPQHPHYAILKALNQPSNSRQSPLHTASSANSLRAAAALLTLGAHANMQDGNGETALHKAGRGSLHAMYRLLTGYGASEAVRNAFRQTPNDLLLDKAVD